MGDTGSKSDDCNAEQGCSKDIKEVCTKKVISGDPADWKISKEMNYLFFFFYGIPQNAESDFKPSARKYSDITK